MPTKAYFEALANVFMHGNCKLERSEVHVDILNDRLEFYFPGGMPTVRCFRNEIFRKFQPTDATLSWLRFPID